MKWRIEDEGWVYRCGGGQNSVTSRTVLARNGNLLCSFMTQSGLGRNDFVPTLSVSSDRGQTWRLRGPIWPHLAERYSITMSISRSADGTLMLFGSRTERQAPGESFWSQETLGILPNELIWASSDNDGRTWTEPVPIPVPLPGAAECPAPMCVTRNGRWVAPYAPHNTFDPDLKVDLQHIVVMISDDQGQSWRHRSAIRVTDPDSYVAEAWVTQLSDGALLATAWHLRRGEGDDYPNAYAISRDRGDTWQPTRAAPILGQSAGLASLPGGRVLMAYNQRRHGEPGVWLALAEPNHQDFGLLHDNIVWHACKPTQNASSGKSSNWTDFGFGEPSVVLLPDNTALVAFWCIQPDGSGVRFVKVGFA